VNRQGSTAIRVSSAEATKRLLEDIDTQIRERTGGLAACLVNLSTPAGPPI
jgi:hypothetical protein